MRKTFFIACLLLYTQTHASNDTIQVLPSGRPAETIASLTKEVTSANYDGDKLLSIFFNITNTKTDSVDLIEEKASVFLKTYEREFDDLLSSENPIAPAAQYILDSGFGEPLYTQVNRTLRSGKKPSKDLQDFIERLEKALDLFPSVETLSFRGAIYGKRVTDTYQPGVTLVEKAYFSTSLSAQVARRFLNPIISETKGTPVLYVVYGYSGKPIFLVSSEYRDEEELLYRPKTRFCVTGRSNLTKNEKILIVILREVQKDCSELQ